ncbi:2-amino-4-hydroxy-6-hydroxymethyldihydropteridine diphosphokinase [Sphingomonas sp.]|uniref:2-amino-4-hydroxy-6- hydroxymethyldihydropteridine diphosphokinase n=1 Tax=Sphingomonas sp. TaxID=28214 RepID=UPI0035BC581E
MPATTYAIALGSNVYGRHGAPERTLAAALAAVGGVLAAAPVIRSDAVGPSRRRYANTVALIASEEPPPALLARLKRIERAFGRRPGRAWGARVLDLDIVLWSQGAWRSAGLTVPHRAFRTRGFVLHPLARIAPRWRDPVTARTVRQLARAVDRPRPRS